MFHIHVVKYECPNNSHIVISVFAISIASIETLTELIRLFRRGGPIHGTRTNCLPGFSHVWNWDEVKTINMV